MDGQQDRSQSLGEKHLIGVVDTTFAVVDMGSVIVDELESSQWNGQVDVERVTVPGFKDLAAPSKRFCDQGASLVLVAGMPGPEPIDEACSHDASFGIQMTQAMTGVPILELFCHMSEAQKSDGSIDEAKLFQICDDRCREHAKNGLRMLFEPLEMIKRAGTGRRQGGPDVGAMGPGVRS